MKRAATILIAGLAAAAVPSAAVHADTAAQVNATVDCYQFTFEVTGAPADALILIAYAGEPPIGFQAVGGAASGSVDLSYFAAMGRSFGWAISVVDGQYTWGIAEGQVDCSAVEAIVMAEPVWVPANPEPVVEVEAFALWAEVALAPPW